MHQRSPLNGVIRPLATQMPLSQGTQLPVKEGGELSQCGLVATAPLHEQSRDWTIQWLIFARAKKGPPMPWFSLREMSDRDLTDIYRFIRSLGPAGFPVPAAVPPGGKVNTPFIVLEPQNLGGPKDLGGPAMSQAAPSRPEPRS